MRITSLALVATTILTASMNMAQAELNVVTSIKPIHSLVAGVMKGMAKTSRERENFSKRSTLGFKLNEFLTAIAKVCVEYIEKRGTLPGHSKSKKTDSIMIGDSYEADIKGALDYGLEAIHLIAHGEALHSDCKIIHKLDELMKIL